MSTALRLQAIAGRSIDDIALGATVRLCRRGTSLWLDPTGHDVGRLRSHLALLGIATAESPAPDEPRPDWIPAIGTSLLPLPATWDLLDVVTVRPLDPGQASARVLGHRWSRLVGTVRHARRERCRALLRRDDALLLWERRAWLPRGAARDPRARAALRPIVFDRSATNQARPGGYVFVRDRALERWAFG